MGLGNPMRTNMKCYVRTESSMLYVWILQEQKVFEEGMNIQRMSKGAREMFWTTYQ